MTTQQFTASQLVADLAAHHAALEAQLQQMNAEHAQRTAAHRGELERTATALDALGFPAKRPIGRPRKLV